MNDVADFFKSQPHNNNHVMTLKGYPVCLLVAAAGPGLCCVATGYLWQSDGQMHGRARGAVPGARPTALPVGVLPRMWLPLPGRGAQASAHRPLQPRLPAAGWRLVRPSALVALAAAALSVLGSHQGKGRAHEGDGGGLLRQQDSGNPGFVNCEMLYKPLSLSSAAPEPSGRYRCKATFCHSPPRLVICWW